ncbi:LexA DNA binding domain-containing protein [Lentzea atacamensis]|uniref:LexA DNA binding domain-containing protein n=2 Tax=Lentzea atacamensis TaxID=531938 RepID=A0A316I2N7_9PSEU|nr:LexA DNA binding domain-containing protein [Lentzea atacamensis]
MTTQDGSLRSKPSAWGPVTNGNALVHRMRELYESGHSIGDIGMVVNRNPSTVYRVLVRLGVQIRGDSFPARQRVLEYIKSYLDERGFPPGVRDIATGLELSSTATVTYHLKHLEADGLIKRTPGVARSIVVLGPEVQP